MVVLDKGLIFLIRNRTMDYFDSHDLRTIDNLELLAKQVVEGFIIGLHKSPFHGFSVEFAEHRLYNPGESTKDIDWKVFARSDKMFVKKFEEETNLRCQIVVDTSSSMYFPEQRKGRKLNKIEFSAVVRPAQNVVHKYSKRPVGGRRGRLLARMGLTGRFSS